MAGQLVPIDSSPNQTMFVTVSINGENRRFRLKVRWNDVSEYWVLTIIDGATMETLIDSLPLLTANYPAANLLESFDYLNIGSLYLVKADSASGDPTDEDLGVNFVLIWSNNV